MLVTRSTTVKEILDAMCHIEDIDALIIDLQEVLADK